MRWLLSSALLLIFVPRRQGGQSVAYQIRLKATDSKRLAIIKHVDVYHTP